MNTPDDLHIIQNILAGNAGAYAGLVDRYKDMAVSLAYNILLNREDAEEVAQDAFVKAYSYLHSFKADAKFSTWLYRIIVNTALNRKKIKKQYAVEMTETMGEELPVDFDNLLATQITGEHRKHIQFALRSVNPNERLCITLYYLNELSVEEIHELTNISVSNIKVLLYRGRKSLFKSMQHYLKTEINNLI